MPYMEGIAQADPVPIARLIGRRVRAGRVDRGWTLDQLAQRSRVSRRMLVNVEQGATNPSIATLLRLSDALGIGLPTLVDPTPDNPGAVVVHRIGDLSPMWTSAAGGSAVMVAGTSPPDVTELWDWHLGPGDAYHGEPHRAGTTELLFVLAGTVELVVGDLAHRLKTGDSAVFDGTIAHVYRNTSTGRPSRFALTVFEPAVGKEPP